MDIRISASEILTAKHTGVNMGRACFQSAVAGAESVFPRQELGNGVGVGKEAIESKIFELCSRHNMKQENSCSGNTYALAIAQPVSL